MVRYKKDTPRPGLIRVPADPNLPLKFWKATVELPAYVPGQRRRIPKTSKDWRIASDWLEEMRETVRKNPHMSTHSLTVAAWMDEYFNTIAKRKHRPKVLNNERGLIRNHVLPVIGKTKLDRLGPADLRRVTESILAKPGKTPGTTLSSTTARQVHWILSGAFEYAVRENLMLRNVADLVDAPAKSVTDMSGLDVEQAIHLILTARDAGDPLWTLWMAVLFTGARQGELLGLELDRIQTRIDPKTGRAVTFLDLAWHLQRITWQHGCNPHCDRKRASDCKWRRMEAPADWARRHLVGGLWLSSPKTRAGTRLIPLVEPLKSNLLQHLESTAGEPNPFGLVWHMPDGNPIDPSYQSKAWHAALERAGLPGIRLHDGRHTTVDLLYEAEVAEDVITEIVGHSTRAVTRGYKSKARQVRKIAGMEQLSDFIAFPESKALES